MPQVHANYVPNRGVNYIPDNESPGTFRGFNGQPEREKLPLRFDKDFIDYNIKKEVSKKAESTVII